MSKKIISLGERTGHVAYSSPEGLLRDCLERMAPGGRWEGAPKLMVIALDDSDGVYSLESSQHGMNNSEVVAMLDVVKTSWRKDLMGET